MKILHCCLAAFYIDNYSYQENILPKMHKLQGHNVMILASTETYLHKAELGYLPPSSYINTDGIPVTRIPYVKWLPHSVAKKMRIYEGILKVVEEFKPDIIFLHDLQFVSITEIAAYAKKHPEVKVYIDGHTDFINSGKNWLSKHILHGIIYKWCAKKIEPFTRKFYGVLPLRVDFFIDVYGMPEEKTELLLLGADHTVVDINKRDEINQVVRPQLNIKATDLVIIAGGKLDRRKNIHVLMNIVDKFQKDDLKLIVFGVPTADMKEEIERFAQSPSIKLIGWLSSEETYNYLLASDLAFFPGTHSVLWEQAIGTGLPCVVKRWTGIEHVDLGGNCLFLDSDNPSEIEEKIMLLYNDRELLNKMTAVARTRGMKEFSYYEIAKKAIEA